jgi:O-antigen/teichoic acid export membrane protein
MTGTVQRSARHTLDGTVRVFLAEALILPTGLITTAILTRELGPEGYGWFTLAASAVAWIEWGIAAFFARAAFLFVAQAEEWRPVASMILRLRLLVSIAAALALAALAEPIAMLLNEPALAGYLRLFAIDIPIFGAGNAHSNVLVGISAFRQRAWPSAARWIVRLALIALFIRLGFSIEGAIWGSIGASVAELVVARRFVKLDLFTAASLPLRRLWPQALPLTLFALSTRLFDRVDLFFLKALGASSAEAGFYGGAQNLSIVPGLVALAFSPLLLSTIARLLKANAEADARDLARQALRAIVAMTPLAAMSAAAAPEIVRLVLGPAFLGAARPLSLLIFAALALVMVSVATSILTAAGKASWSFYLTAPMVPIAAAGHLLLVPLLWGTGAALVTLSTATLAAVATVLAVHRLWGVAPPFSTMLRSAVISVGAYAATAAWPCGGALVVIKLALVCLGIGLGFVLLGELRPRPRAMAAA